MSNINNPHMTPLERAIETAGGAKALADMLNVSSNLPVMWRTRGNVPAEWCPSIERAAGVACEELRPDVRWQRVPDAIWPHPGGRPCIDVAAPQAA